ncbi:MAG: diguanylate cyclase [Acidovorax sp.]|nr:diguanylate cyclase [Acidovorax sp.]
MAEHAVKLIRALALPRVASLTAEHVTISVGIAVCAGSQLEQHGPQALYKAADRALYAAKAQGRDRWVAEVMG